MTTLNQGSVMRQLFDSMKRHASEAGELLAISDQYGQLSRHQLLARVAALAARLKDQPRTIGIYAPNGRGWVIAQLACAFAGKLVVPLPTFFSPAQLGHACLRTNGGAGRSIGCAHLCNRHSSVGTGPARSDRWLRPDHLYFRKYWSAQRRPPSEWADRMVGCCVGNRDRSLRNGHLSLRPSATAPVGDDLFDFHSNTARGVCAFRYRPG